MSSPRPSEHCDEVNLALVAAGGPAPSAVFARHMRACPTCAERLDDYGDVVAVAVASMEDRAYSQPPGKVWLSIAAAAGPAGSQPDLVIEGMPARLRPQDRPIVVQSATVRSRAKVAAGAIAALVMVLLAVFAALFFLGN